MVYGLGFVVQGLQCSQVYSIHRVVRIAGIKGSYCLGLENRGRGSSGEGSGVM